MIVRFTVGVGCCWPSVGQRGRVVEFASRLRVESTGWDLDSFISATRLYPSKIFADMTSRNRKKAGKTVRRRKPTRNVPDSAPVSPPSAERSESFKEPALPNQQWEEIQYRTDEVIKQVAIIASALTDDSSDPNRRIRCALDAVLNGMTAEQAVQLETVGKLSSFIGILSRSREELFQQISAKVAPAGQAVRSVRQPIRILHLSDLHFTRKTSVAAEAQALQDDILKGEALGFSALDFLVISGDLTDRGSEDGFGKAVEFVTELVQRFKLSNKHCICVPGNHDTLRLKDLFYADLGPNDSVIAVQRDDVYPKRFEAFSRQFFRPALQSEYPLDFAKQGIPYLFPQPRIQFLTLNSCWQIDAFNPKRSAIHGDALANLIQTADEQVARARSSQELPSSANVLRIGVWHHAVTGTGNEKIQDDGFISQLQKDGVRVCLHGDIHKLSRELICYWHSRQMHVVGAGTFGAAAADRPESMPRSYNLLEVQPDLSKIRVHTRHRPRPTESWEPWAVWTKGGSRATAHYFPFYDTTLR